MTRRRPQVVRKLECAICGSQFSWPRYAKYCSGTCRNRARDLNRSPTCSRCGYLMSYNRTTKDHEIQTCQDCRREVASIEHDLSSLL